MDELRFNGRTAVVTGAGGNPSLGRLYALLLADRGANVVVNDIGHVPEVPTYPDEANPQAVVDEIQASGGKAVVNYSDVATKEGADALIDAAIGTFGSIDILVNNAALCILASFDEVTPRHFRRMIDTDLMGPAWTSRAAWPHMKERGYGRIVNIGAGVFGGNQLMAAYSASKGGLFMLTQALAMEGYQHGIMVNTVHPVGYSRMVLALQQEGSPMVATLRDSLRPDDTAPIVGLLAHEKCPVTGECFDTAGGRVNRTVIARNHGYSEPGQTMETLMANWDKVMDTSEIDIVARNAFSSDTWSVRPYSDYANA